MSRAVKKLCAVKGVDFQRVKFPPGNGSLQPVAIRAAGHFFARDPRGVEFLAVIGWGILVVACLVAGAALAYVGLNKRRLLLPNSPVPVQTERPVFAEPEAIEDWAEMPELDAEVPVPE